VKWIHYNRKRTRLEFAAGAAGVCTDESKDYASAPATMRAIIKFSAEGSLDEDEPILLWSAVFVLALETKLDLDIWITAEKPANERCLELGSRGAGFPFRINAASLPRSHGRRKLHDQ
jgi:hypothetical protein